MDNKAIAILELTSGATGLDQKLNKSLYYFWTKSTIFSNFPVVDVSTGVGENNIEKTLYLLDLYYAKGYRIFLGFSLSTVLAACLTWFKEHPDATGVTALASAGALILPKNVFRVRPTVETTIKSIDVPLQSAIDNGGKIYCIYSDLQVASYALLTYLNNVYGAENIISYAVQTDGANLTIDNMNIFYENATAVDVVVTCLIFSDERDKYYSFFNNVDGLDKPFTQYDPLTTGFPYIDPVTTTLKNKLIVLLVKSTTVSVMWNDALLYLKDNFSPNSLNTLFFITTLINNFQTNKIYSYNGVLEFDQNNGLAYYSYGFYKYTDLDIFIASSLSVYDPIYGKMILNAI